jgi:hypothetical protein
LSYLENRNGDWKEDGAENDKWIKSRNWIYS